MTPLHLLRIRRETLAAEHKRLKFIDDRKGAKRVGLELRRVTNTILAMELENVG